MITIYNEILPNIKPSDKQRQKIIDFSNNLMNIIQDYASSKNVTLTCRLVGSMAKKTSLINKADIDIFMVFPLDYDEKDLKRYGLEFGEYCINQVNGKSEIRYASHPYITGLIDGFEVDFVPCYNIKDASQLKSAVDRTILHTDYIQSHITNEEVDEVLLLKKFMGCVNTYGANYKVSGFSGYLCELLILKYHSFENVIKTAATKWSNSYKLDLEGYGTASNYNDPLIFIDPVDKNRNVAAALSMQKFSEFIVASRNYLSCPSKEYFTEKNISINKKDMLEEFKTRKTGCYVFSFNVPDLPTDIIYPQVNKTRKSLVKISRMHDFIPLNSSYYIDSDRVAHIILEYEVDRLPNVKIHCGPKVYDEKNSNNFKTKYPNSYVINDKWHSLTNRKYTSVSNLINKMIFKKNRVQLGKNLKEEILKGYNLETIEEFIKKEKDKNLDELYIYLHPNYRLYR